MNFCGSHQKNTDLPFVYLFIYSETINKKKGFKKVSGAKTNSRTIIFQMVLNKVKKGSTRKKNIYFAPASLGINLFSTRYTK